MNQYELVCSDVPFSDPRSIHSSYTSFQSSSTSFHICSY